MPDLGPQCAPSDTRTCREPPRSLDERFYYGYVVRLFGVRIQGLQPFDIGSTVSPVGLRGTVGPIYILAVPRLWRVPFPSQWPFGQDFVLLIWFCVLEPIISYTVGNGTIICK